MTEDCLDCAEHILPQICYGMILLDAKFPATSQEGPSPSLHAATVVAAVHNRVIPTAQKCAAGD